MYLQDGPRDPAHRTRGDFLSLEKRCGPMALSSGQLLGRVSVAFVEFHWHDCIGIAVRHCMIVNSSNQRIHRSTEAIPL